MLETEIREAYENLRRALEETLETTIRHRRAKEALETAVAQGIVAGEVAGKNAEEREAKARTLYAKLFQAILEAEEALTRAKFRLEMAKARTREVEVLVNLVGLTFPGTPGTHPGRESGQAEDEEVKLGTKGQGQD